MNSESTQTPNTSQRDSSQKNYLLQKHQLEFLQLVEHLSPMYKTLETTLPECNFYHQYCGPIANFASQPMTRASIQSRAAAGLRTNL